MTTFHHVRIPDRSCEFASIYRLSARFAVAVIFLLRAPGGLFWVPQAVVAAGICPKADHPAQRKALRAPYPLTSGSKTFSLSRPASHERGESRREGHPIRETLLSPTLSSLLRREEREKGPKDFLVSGRKARTMSWEISPPLGLEVAGERWSVEPA